MVAKNLFLHFPVVIFSFIMVIPILYLTIVNSVILFILNYDLFSGALPGFRLL
uniref:Uncharacterized protein n=1 Tax=Rhizophora mucronata TaxID=61149 RepID=A0A2P2R3R7_RHIMU